MGCDKNNKEVILSQYGQNKKHTKPEPSPGSGRDQPDKVQKMYEQSTSAWAT